MIGKELVAIEPYIGIILLIHTLLSLLLALLLAKYIAKRFISSDVVIDARDKMRIEAMSERSLFIRLLFNVSLHKNNPKTSAAFLFLFIFTTPIIGYVAAIWIAWYLRNIKYTQKVTNTNILNLDEFGISFFKVERIFGEGSMVNLMKSKYAPKSKKLKALSTLASSVTPANLRIVRETLSSTDDEIRMFGYAIMNKAEKSLSMKINKYLSVYNEEMQKKEKNEQRIAEAAKEIAPLYWEMIYTELSHESLRESFLTEVVKYATIAKEYYVAQMKHFLSRVADLEEQLNALEHDAEVTTVEALSRLEESYKKSVELSKKHSETCIKLYILMGRVYMLKREYDSAITELTIAQELNDDESSYVLPYLAEIHYIQGNYKTVNAILSKAEDLRLNTTLYPVVEQWRVS